MSKEDTQWKEGESGNPNGRPKKENCLTDLMREFLEEGNNKKEFIKQVYKQGMSGDNVCQKMIWNYLDGLPKQKIEFTGSIEDNSVLKALKDVNKINTNNNNDVKSETD